METTEAKELEDLESPGLEGYDRIGVEVKVRGVEKEDAKRRIVNFL